MTPQLNAWAARTGARLAADYHRRRHRTRQTASQYLAAELPRCGDLLSGMLRAEVTKAYLAAVVELLAKEQADG